MGLFSWLTSKFTSPTPPVRPEADEKPKPGERKLAAMLPHYAYTGGWSDDRIKQIHHFTYWMYVGGHAICKKMASLGSPNIGWVDSTPLARKSGSQRNNVWRKSQDVIKPHEDVEHVPLNHPALKLYDRPNAYDVNFDLWYELPMFKILTGSSYLWTSARNGIGLPAELWVLPSHWVFPRGGKDKLIDHYEVRPYGGSAGMMELDPGDLLHFKSKNPRSKIDGLAATAAGAKWIDTSESVDTARWAQMKNQMRPELAITLKPDVNPDDEELNRFYQKFHQRFQGEGKTGLPIIIKDAEDVIPLEYPAEIFYIQTAEQMRDFVLCGLMSVQKEVVGMQPSGSDLSWWAPLHQFCTQAINPETKYVGQMLTRWVQQYDPKLRVWWDDCTPDNPDQINKDLELDMKWGIRTLNEARSIRGLEPYKNGGDDPFLPQTLSPYPLNTGEDLSGYDDLMPGGEPEQPALDPMGNPLPQEPPAPLPVNGSANGNGVAHDPANPMGHVQFKLPAVDGLAAAREAVVNGLNRLRGGKSYGLNPSPDVAIQADAVNFDLGGMTAKISDAMQEAVRKSQNDNAAMLTEVVKSLKATNEESIRLAAKAAKATEAQLAAGMTKLAEAIKSAPPPVVHVPPFPKIPEPKVTVNVAAQGKRKLTFDKEGNPIGSEPE